MRVVAALLVSALAASPAVAQPISPLTGSVAPAPLPPMAPLRHRPTLAERFDRANTSHDGRLTRAQAYAGHMNDIARNFSAIDAGHRGYVTMDDVRAYQKSRRNRRPAS